MNAQGLSIDGNIRTGLFMLEKCEACSTHQDEYHSKLGR